MGAQLSSPADATAPPPAARRRLPAHAFLDLPLDVVQHVATYFDRPAAVVACPRDCDDARRALRAGVDVAERARFPGATTVREAEAFVRENYPDSYPFGDGVDNLLATRRTASEGLADICSSARHLEFASPLLSYGADPNVGTIGDEYYNETPLHTCTYGFPEFPQIVALLIAAGADVDAKSHTPDGDMSPLALAFENCDSERSDPLRFSLSRCQVAKLLMTGGADIFMANRDYLRCGNELQFDDILRRLRNEVTRREDDPLLDELLALISELLQLVDPFMLIMV